MRRTRWRILEGRGYGGGGGSGSSGGGAGGATASGAPPAGQPPLAGGSGFGAASVTGAGEGVIDLTSVVFRVITSACGGNPECVEVLLGAGALDPEVIVPAAAAGAAIGYGVAALQNYIHQSRRIAPNQAENEQVDLIARDFCVDRIKLGEEVHREKQRFGKLTLEDIKEIAKSLPKIPGRTPREG